MRKLQIGIAAIASSFALLCAAPASATTKAEYDAAKDR
jgi:hypothetical protein